MAGSAMLRFTWLALFCLACASSPPQNDSLPTVLYDGATTDEALEHLLSLPRTEGPALTLLSPSDDSLLDPGSPPTIVFAEGVALWTPPPASEERRLFPRLAGALDRIVGISEAHAHGAPYNGVAYLLEVSDKDQKKRLAVFTDQISFKIPEAEWSDLSSYPDPFLLTVSSATFEENKVTAAGGPFVRAHASFSIR